VLGIVNSEIVKVTDENVQKEIYINTEVLGIVNGEIVKVTDENVLTISNTSVLISTSFCTFSSVTFTISLLIIPNTSVLIYISFCTFSSVTFDENVQKEIDINTEVLG
jgi:hypothetical protein